MSFSRLLNFTLALSLPLIASATSMANPGHTCLAPEKIVRQAIVADLKSKAQASKKFAEISVGMSRYCGEVLRNESMNAYWKKDADFDVGQVIATDTYEASAVTFRDPVKVVSKTCRIEVQIVHSASGRKGTKILCEQAKECPIDLTAGNDFLFHKTGGEEVPCFSGGMPE